MSAIKHLLASRPQLLWGLALAASALVLAANALWAMNNISALVAAGHSIGLSREARDGIDDLFSMVKDAETAQRGYLLTQDRAYLEPYEAAERAIPQKVASLRLQFADEPEQQARLGESEKLIGEKMSELAQTIKLADAGDVPAAMQLVHTSRGLELMQEVRALMETMRRAEQASQAEKKARSDEYYSETQVTNLLGALIGALLVGVAALVLNREFRTRAQFAEQLFLRGERLNATLHSIGDAVIVTDPSARVVMLNAIAEDLLGVPSADAVGKPLVEIFDIVNEVTREPVQNPVTRAIAEGKIVGLANHTVLRSRNGAEYVIEDSAAPTFGSDGTIQGAVMVFRDSTLRRQAEIALSQASEEIARRARIAVTSEHTLNTILENAPVGIFLTGPAPDFRIMAMSHQIREWIGATKEKLPAETAYRKVMADGTLPPPSLLPLHRVMEDASIVRDETWIVECQGRPPLRVVVNVAPVRDSDGHVVGAVHSWIDLSERERLDRALRITESRLRVLVDSNVIGLLLSFDDSGNVADANDAFLDMLGFDRADLDAALINLKRQTPEKYRALDEQAFEQVVETGSCLPYEKELMHKDGERRISVVVGYARVAGAKSECVGFVLDVTERKQLELQLRTQTERLVAADRRKDEFLAMLAHELRNPLAPLRNAVHLLEQSGGVDRDLTESIVPSMRRQIEHLVRMVDDLLDVARITRNKIRLERKVLELGPVVEAAVETVRPSIDLREHRVHVEIISERLYVYGDDTRLNQVFANILHNAAKYTTKGGDIHVSLSRQDNAAVVRVRDTGDGISAELLPNIFDAFTQADHSLARSAGGLGVGLAMVRRLCELHGGTASAHSEGNGRGSEFEVRLPLVDAPADAAVAVVESGTSPDARTRRVLLVDDNPDVADSTAALLELWGHTVRVEQHGRNVIAAAIEFRPDVVLLDIGLPDVDGFEIARRIKSHEDLRGLRVVAVSGYSQTKDLRRAKEAGFDLHVAKPVQPEKLRALLQDI